MSQLRNQFNSAREGYLAEQYPGDLASLISPARGSWWPRIVGVAIGSAVAASIAIVLMNQAIGTSAGQRGVIVPAAQQRRPVLSHFPGMPELPQRTTLDPTPSDEPVFLPALPSFPSLGEALSDSINRSETNQQNPPKREAL